MSRCLVLTVLLLIFQGCSGGGSDEQLSSDACGLLGLPTESAKIVNGSTCGSLSESPVVRVVTVDKGQRIRTFCTGTMITTREVLTAAHCFARRSVNTYVSYGSGAGETLVEATSVDIHPGYTALGEASSESTFNDVAVIHLSRSVPLPNLRVLTSRAVDAGEVVSVFGYGSDENGTFDGIYLRSGQMRIDQVTDAHVIAGYDGEGSNTCQGDSGGPLVAVLRNEAVVAGITATGSQEGCGPGDRSFFINLHSEAVQSFLRDAAPGAGFL